MIGPSTKSLKKGELLFDEGESSRAMYVLKSGMIRIFKRKSGANIEIDTIRSGQILGELAFLDGNPRSAAAEALIDSELLEISNQAYAEAMKSLPEWLMLLVKTIVGRLRSASTKIRQLESASVQYVMSEKDGMRTSQYVFLSLSDILKTSTALLLVSSQSNEKSKDGTSTAIRVSQLQKYAHQILNVPVSKITAMLDVFAQNAIVHISAESAEVAVKDSIFLEKFIAYMNEENLLEPSKRHDLSHKGFLILSLIAKWVPTLKADPSTGMTTVNLAEIRSKELNPKTGKELFRLEDFEELVRLGYASTMNVKSTNEVTTLVKTLEIQEAARLQKIVKTIELANEREKTKK